MWQDSSSPEFKYPYDPRDGRENLGAGEDVPRVMRGGSFFDDQGFVRCAYRYRGNPYIRLRFSGFRVVVVPVVSGL